jgi:hypothetical protein
MLRNKVPAYMNQYPARLTHGYAEERRCTVTHQCKVVKSVGQAVEITQNFKISKMNVHTLYLTFVSRINHKYCNSVLKAVIFSVRISSQWVQFLGEYLKSLHDTLNVKHRGC